MDYIAWDRDRAKEMNDWYFLVRVGMRGTRTDKLVMNLTLLPPIPLRLYTLPYWSNPPFLIFDIRALWRSVLSARAPECQKFKMVG